MSTPYTCGYLHTNLPSCKNERLRQLQSAQRRWLKQALEWKYIRQIPRLNAGNKTRRTHRTAVTIRCRNNKKSFDRRR